MIFFVQNLIINKKLIIRQKYITSRIKRRMAFSLIHYN